MQQVNDFFFLNSFFELFSYYLIAVAGQLRHHSAQRHQRPPQSHAQAQRGRDGQTVAALLFSALPSLGEILFFFFFF